jgi:hypothetical protein
MMLKPHHHVGIHVDETAIAVAGETAIAGPPRKTFDGCVIEAEIEHRIHHARHRSARPRAHREKERAFGIAELCTDFIADMRKGRLDLRFETLRIGAIVGVVGGADLGGDGKARRNRQSECGHFGEVGALAAEEFFHARIAVGHAGTEAIDEFGRPPGQSVLTDECRSQQSPRVHLVK